MNLDESIPMLTVSYQKTSPEFVTVSQPHTGNEIKITGLSMNIWNYLEGNREIAVLDVYNALKKDTPELEKQHVYDVVNYLNDLQLLTLEEPGDW